MALLSDPPPSKIRLKNKEKAVRDDGLLIISNSSLFLGDALNKVG